MAEINDIATLLIRYRDIDYPVRSCYMPQTVLSRRDRSADYLRTWDREFGLVLHNEINAKLEQIYSRIISPEEIKVIASLAEKPKRTNEEAIWEAIRLASR